MAQGSGVGATSEGEPIDEDALKTLVRAVVTLNTSKARRKQPGLSG